jgi:hypothetical protein
MLAVVAADDQRGVSVDVPEYTVPLLAADIINSAPLDCRHVNSALIVLLNALVWFTKSLREVNFPLLSTTPFVTTEP